MRSDEERKCGDGGGRPGSLGQTWGLLGRGALDSRKQPGVK